ncbi:MAG TPA: HD domain-containing protein [archaeon]|nr:HD domain-containing protein [archaeon]
MKLPTEKECSALIAKYEVPENVAKHTESVRRIANILSRGISSNGFKIDLECVDKGALMHDVAKMYCIKNNCRHAAEAEKALTQIGYSEFGKVLLLHGLEEVLGFNKSTPLEAKVVWYADKRVTHDKIVSLRERYDYLKERYGSISAEKMNEIISTEKSAYALESELVQMAGLGKDFLEGAS